MLDHSLAVVHHPDPTDLVPVRYPPDRHPASVYLSKLAPSGRRTMRIALNRVACLVQPGLDAENFPWTELRYQHTAAIRARLVETLDPEHEPHYSVSTVNVTLAAMRGVLREAWRLGYLSAEELARAIDVANVKAVKIPKGRAVTHGEVLAMVEATKRRGTPSSIRDAAVLALGWACGLRRSEIVSLKFDDYRYPCPASPRRARPAETASCPRTTRRRR